MGSQGLLERKKSKGILKLGEHRSGGVVVSQKQGKCLTLLQRTLKVARRNEIMLQV